MSLPDLPPLSALKSAPSLSARLIWRVLLLSVAMVVVISAFSYAAISSTLETLRDRDLHGQADDLQRYVQRGADGALSLALPEPLANRYRKGKGSFRYAMLELDLAPADDPARATVIGRPIQAWPASPGPLAQVHDEGLFRFVDEQTGEVFNGVSHHNDGYVIQVAQGQVHDDALAVSVIEELLEHAIWLFIPATLLILGLIVLTIRQSLQPVCDASEQAALITPRSEGVQLPTQGIPREILPLVTAVNQALERMAQALEQQRSFTANAAHELRTPLAVLQANIDTLPSSDDKTLLLADLARMSRIVTQLLNESRLENARIGDGQQADLLAVAQTVAGFMAPLALKAGREIEVIGEAPNLIHGDPALLEQALRNLVENALAFTPHGGTVTIDASHPARLTARDTGKGLSDADIPHLFERFWRARGQQHRTGSGLGLSIVKGIMTLHNGTVTPRNHPNGGAEFALDFPSF